MNLQLGADRSAVNLRASSILQSTVTASCNSPQCSITFQHSSLI